MDTLEAVLDEHGVGEQRVRFALPTLCEEDIVPAAATFEATRTAFPVPELIFIASPTATPSLTPTPIQIDR